MISDIAKSFLSILHSLQDIADYYFRSLQMNCLQFLPRSSVFPLQSFKAYSTKPSCTGVMNATDLPRVVTVKGVSGSTSCAEMSNSNVEEEKSEVYSNNMTAAMGARKFIHVMNSDLCISGSLEGKSVGGFLYRLVA
ncbi:Phosphoglucan phosphatase DSP4, chloroplastic [Sarracenia purpurea var. burkii]